MGSTMFNPVFGRRTFEMWVRWKVIERLGKLEGPQTTSDIFAQKMIFEKSFFDRPEIPVLVILSWLKPKLEPGSKCKSFHILQELLCQTIQLSCQVAWQLRVWLLLVETREIHTEVIHAWSLWTKIEPTKLMDSHNSRRVKGISTKIGHEWGGLFWPNCLPGNMWDTSQFREIITGLNGCSAAKRKELRSAAQCSLVSLRVA